MKNKIIFGIFTLLLACNTGYTQCNEKMYELAIAQVGNDVMLVRDFKVKLNEGTKRNPAPSSRFSVLMQHGITYRFIVVKDKQSLTEPILQLYNKSQLLGSTFDALQGKANDRFDFLCNRTGNYQVILSMRGSKEGCTVGIMAMVTDSAFYAQGNKKPEDNRSILYAGIATPLNLITDQPEVGKISMHINHGEIIEKDGAFSALVPNEGPVKIDIKLYNKSDSIIEDTEQEFNVIPLPYPKVSLEGATSEYISIASLGSVVHLNIEPEVYRVVEFQLWTEPGFNTGYQSTSDQLTIEMLNFLKTLHPQQKFYIKQVRVAKPDGSEIVLAPQAYYVR